MSLKSLLKLTVILCFLFLWGCAGSLNLENFSQQYENISRHYQKMVESNPEDKKLKLKLARFYYTFRDYPRIIDILQNSNALEARMLLAKTYAQLKEYDYAIEIFEKLKQSASTEIQSINDPEYFYLYGKVLESKNLFSKAIETYKKVGTPLKEKAEERIRLIKTKTERKFPPYILELAQEGKDFKERMAEEAAITFLVDEEMEVTPQNTSISTIHVIEQVLKERGKDLGEVQLSYDSTYERVELEYARSISKDGRVVYAGKENIRDVNKYLNYPLYSNAKAFIISMPLVEVGSFIEYKIKIYSSKLMNKDDFSFLYRLREKYPIFKAQFKLTVPQLKEVHFRFLNKRYAKGYNLNPLVEKRNGKKIYFWQLKEIEPLLPEYNMPPSSLVNPAILISTFSSWQEIYQWWYTLFEDKLTLSATTQNFVRELIKDADTDLDKAKKIYEFCAQNIRYVAVEYGESGYEPHTAEEVFINRYGDCKDQAILLTAMLRFAGIKGYPVLIPTRKAYEVSKDFPSVNFNHAICAIESEGKFIFIDPTAETTSFLDLPLSDQDRLVMVFMDNGWRLLRTPQIEDNGTIYEMTIKLDDREKATIRRTVTTRGFFTSAHRWYLKYTHPSKIKQDIQQKMVKISSFSRLIDYEIKNVDNLDKPPLLSYKFVTDKFLNPAGELRIVPVLGDIRLDYNLVGKEERIFPIDFGGIFTNSCLVKLVLPSSLKVKYVPSERHLETKWFKFDSSYKVDAENLISKQEFAIKKRFVPIDEYKEFKQQLEKVLYLLREELILEKTQ
jgi:tetratricopeptide (TPR) repeat protein